jgi:ABC-type multidrug transport system ATPase subunit
MLTGVHQVTSGDAIIYGNRITTEMEQVQRNIGLC